MNGVQTRFKCKLDVKRCKRFVFPPSSLLPRSNALKTKAIRYFQTDRTLTRIVSPPLNEQTVETPASTTALDLELDTNLKYDLYRIRYLVTYSSENPEENWIEEVSYDSEKLHIKLAANPTYEPRSAQVRLAISIPANTINGGQKVVTTSTTITQLGKE